MMTLSETEYRVLDELYFLTSYAELLHQTLLQDDILQITLLTLLHKELITQHRYDSHTGQFELLDLPEPENLPSSGFVASRKGLLLHNSR